MEKIAAYFESLATSLQTDFAKRRKLLTDSDAKGTGNEKLVADFLQSHFQPARLVLNKQIIDSYGAASDEIDVCACNFYQPAPESDLIIAEGIDFVVQVKAIITDNELDRIMINAGRVKQLRRQFSHNDALGNFNIKWTDFYVQRIPYFVIAFDSQLATDTILTRLGDKTEHIDPELQPDGLFVLNRAAYFNCRAGGFLKSEGTDLQGWNMADSKDWTIFEFIKHVHTVLTDVMRLRHPLSFYLSRERPYGGATLVTPITNGIQPPSTK